MVESRPVAVCVVFKAASAWSAENVFARNVGTVHESAPPRTVLRRNSRRVWRGISLFINPRSVDIRGCSSRAEWHSGLPLRQDHLWNPGNRAELFPVAI